MYDSINRKAVLMFFPINLRSKQWWIELYEFIIIFTVLLLLIGVRNQAAFYREEDMEEPDKTVGNIILLISFIILVISIICVLYKTG